MIVSSVCNLHSTHAQSSLLIVLTLEFRGFNITTVLIFIPCQLLLLLFWLLAGIENSVRQMPFNTSGSYSVQQLNKMD